MGHVCCDEGCHEPQPDRGTCQHNHRVCAPAPMVAPQAAGTVLPAVDDLKNITGDETSKPASVGPPQQIQRRRNHRPPGVLGKHWPGSPNAYNLDAMSGYHAQEFTDTRTLLSSVEVIQAVAVFHDVPARNRNSRRC